jgi:hypothetical protein
MTPARLQAIVRRVRYKPGWTIRVDSSGDVVVTARVADAYYPGCEPVDPPRSYVVVHASVMSRWTTATALERIADAIQRLENHEFGEWFKYRGRRTFDPHQGGRR